MEALPPTPKCARASSGYLIVKKKHQVLVQRFCGSMVGTQIAKLSLLGNQAVYGNQHQGERLLLALRLNL